MEGWKLKEESCNDIRMSDDEIWSVMNSFLSGKRKVTTSYKYGFLKSILDNLYNVDGNLCITYEKLFSTFAEIYWNLLCRHELTQIVKSRAGRYQKSRVELIVEKYASGFPAAVPFESLDGEVQEAVSAEVLRDCSKNVVGALYGDFQGKLYGFSGKGRYIQLNPSAYEFFQKFKVDIERLNYYEWAKFLEKANEGTIGLLGKLEGITHRTNLSYYRRILYEVFEETNCFYCGRSLKETMQVDHFVPWSFNKENQLWNFVLSCPACNRKKSNKLAAKNYLIRLQERNEEIVTELPDMDNLDVQMEFQEYDRRKLLTMYQAAVTNGYHQIWTPDSNSVQQDTKV